VTSSFSGQRPADQSVLLVALADRGFDHGQVRFDLDIHDRKQFAPRGQDHTGCHGVN